jgi:hypothetical protein
MKTTVLVSMDVALAVELNEAVTLKGVNRSAIVASAIRHYLTEHIADAIVESRWGNRSNQDGKDAAGEALILANPDMSIRELTAVFEGNGIKRKKTWISDHRSKLGMGGKQKPAADAQAEAAIRKVMRRWGHCTVRELKQATSSKTISIGDWEKALKALCQSGEMRIAEYRTAAGHARRTVILVKDAN